MISPATEKNQVLNMLSADYIPDRGTGRDGEVSA